MALQKKTNKPEAPQFEDESETQTNQETLTTEKETTMLNETTTTTGEVSTVGTSAQGSTQLNPAAQAKAFQAEFSAMENALDTSYDVMPMFKANQGKIGETSGDKRKLGRWAKVQLIGWSRRLEISPGEQGKQYKDYVAYSKDTKTIDSVFGEDFKVWIGSPVQEYLNFLKKEEELSKASSRLFVDCAVAVLGSETDECIGEVVNISLSSSSIRSFEKYQNELNAKARCAAMGIKGFDLPDNPFQFYFITEDATNGNNEWTRIRISSDLPSKF